MAKSGVIILDSDRRIVVVTPVAEDVLGWRSSQVEGMDCRLVLDCRDADGASLCDHCGATCALESQEMTRSQPIRMSEATGGRVSVNTTFWYLPPSGFIWEPRVMAVFNGTGGATGGATDEHPRCQSIELEDFPSVLEPAARPAS